VPEVDNQGYFPKTAFRIDLEAGTCTCPNGQTTADLRPAQGGGGMFVFATETCAACPVRAHCTRGRAGRTVQLHPQEALLQQARELQARPACAEYRRRRQVVEHRIARLVQLGIRQARYVGRTKTRFQVCLAAAVANLTLLAATSQAFNIGGVQAGELPILLPATVMSLFLTLALATGAGSDFRCLDHLVRPLVPITPPLQASSRPAF
jgi:hypothetical protein